MRFFVLFFLCVYGFEAVAQENPGIIIGNILDEKSRGLEGATVLLSDLKDSSITRSALSDANGAFRINQIPFGYYRLKISFTGLQTLVMDSIFVRAERYDFNLNDVILKASSSEKLEEIIIYSEKPLIQSKEGNITFNAGESALSASGNASELLTNVPLVTKDPNGRILVRGKEPKILIDDKPVELNLQQLQDLLESMPGSSVEKIEVMTNPPPQYANEQGGVINIVTRKGSVGMNGRLSVYAGSRGDAGGNASFNYRKQGFSLNINGGAGYNYFEGNGYSKRENIYKDSTNYLNTESIYRNKNLRPNFRMNLNYDINKFHSLNLVLLYNGNDFVNRNSTTYSNLNRNHEVYKLSNRNIKSSGTSYNPNISLSYTLKTKKAGESLKIISNLNYSVSSNTKDFYQQFFNPDGTPNGIDSSQQQINDNNTRGYNYRANYELPLINKKTFLSFGTFYNLTRSDIEAEAAYKKSGSEDWLPIDALKNDFTFTQKIYNGRASIKQLISKSLSSTMGINAEQTMIRFDLYKQNTDTTNSYWSFLPFATLNKIWKDVLNLTFSYRRTVRRPGINELNPTIDFSDPYNIRFGNPGLLASTADNFDLVFGKSKSSFYANIGMGYNLVRDIFAQVRTLRPDGKTEITWENISGRKEYEISTWNGYTISRHTRVNFSASYTYNTYSEFDKNVRKYRNGGSITSNLNGNYNIKDLYVATGSFTFNRFANPQGSVKSSLSMNIGLQAKFLKKKLTANLNIIDPFFHQENRTFTYGTNFNLESFGSTQTTNYRFSLAYNFAKKQKKKPVQNVKLNQMKKLTVPKQ